MAITLLVLGTVGDLYAENKPVVIVTDEEGSQRDAPSGKGMFGSSDSSDGPEINFEKPTPESEQSKPVAIKISFHAKDAPVDINSLKVTYLKFVSVDITDRVKPYATVDGIDIEKADLPEGSHKVRFSIRDTEDRLSEKTLRVKILE